MPHVHTLSTVIDDEQRNCEYLAVLHVEVDNEASAWAAETDPLPVLVDVEVIEIRILDASGEVQHRHRDPSSAARVAQLLEDPLELRAALENEQQDMWNPTGERDAPHSTTEAPGRLRRVVARQRAAAARAQHADRDRGVG